MLKQVIPYILLLMFLATGLAFASNPASCYAGHAKVCKTSSLIAKVKASKIYTCPFSNKLKSEINQPLREKNEANTFEIYIAPFLKTVVPHFYNQVIKKEPNAEAGKAANDF